MLKEFRENFIGVLTLVVVALAIYGLVKLGTPVAAAPATIVAPAQSDDLGAADQHLHAAIYTTTGGQTSTLGLNNSQNHPLTAQVTRHCFQPGRFWSPVSSTEARFATLALPSQLLQHYGRQLDSIGWKRDNSAIPATGAWTRTDSTGCSCGSPRTTRRLPSS